jgi:hypothetical protein
MTMTDIGPMDAGMRAALLALAARIGGCTAVFTGDLEARVDRREAALGAARDGAMLAIQLLSGEAGCEALRRHLSAAIGEARALLAAEFPSPAGTEPGA